VMHTKFIVVCLVSNQLLMVGMTTYSIVVTLPKRMGSGYLFVTTIN
jgi:hypothetical protein